MLQRIDAPQPGPVGRVDFPPLAPGGLLGRTWSQWRWLDSTSSGCCVGKCINTWGGGAWLKNESRNDWNKIYWVWISEDFNQNFGISSFALICKGFVAQRKTVMLRELKAWSVKIGVADTWKTSVFHHETRTCSAWPALLQCDHSQAAPPGFLWNLHCIRQRLPYVTSYFLPKTLPISPSGKLT